MKIYNTIIAIVVLAFTAGCSSFEEDDASTTNRRVEIKTYLQAPNANTRVSLVGDVFEKGDQVTLYYGVPTKDHKIKGTYTCVNPADNSVWTGTGLYWDDFARTASNNSFVGIANNATVVLGDAHTCEVKADQKKDADYKASDLLVAYATSDQLQDVVLLFNHVFAHFVINITDKTKTTNAENPLILGDKSEVTIKGIKRNSTITFATAPFTAESKTTIEAKLEGAPDQIVTRKVSSKKDSGTELVTNSYELILPAQSLTTDVSLSIESKINGKTYNYDLSGATITGISDKEKMLVQGQTTTLNLSISKTDIGPISATLTPWVNTSASGETTPEDYPILEIKEAKDLNDIINKGEDFAGKTIKLTADIDASTLSLPIGQCPTPFRGIFDGQGYTIKNVTLDASKDASEKTLPAFLGLFGCTEGATIMNLNIEGVAINNTSQSSSTATGALIGYAVDTKVLNCHVKGAATVEATHDNVGGLIGYADGCTIDLSSTTVTVIGHHNYAGGLIGEALLTTITCSYATGDATLNKTDNSSILGGYYAGGLVGYLYGSSTLTNCYAWGNAQSGSYAGGLLGGCGNVTIQSCYAAGTVSKDIGAGLIGIAEHLELKNVTHCYWNASALGSGDTQADGVNNGTKIANEVNISFVLTATPVSMEPVLEGLNKTNSAWEAGMGKAQNYSLPILIKNSGRASQANLVVLTDKTK